jgi:signal transduction histidine kinase/DNA-binding LacI/PurR family transcriptional regulator/AraC-like DNA-binding protein
MLLATRFQMPNSQRSNQKSCPTLGLLTHGGGDPVGHFVWSGVENIAQVRDVNLICFPGKSLRSPLGFEAQSNVLYDLINSQLLDGLIIWLAGLTFQINLEEVKNFCERYRPLPIVTVGVHVEGIPSVTVDNYHGMHDVVSHLVTVHGRSRIALIRGPEHHQEAEERYQAYLDVLREHDLAFDPELTVIGGFKKSGAIAGIEELLDRRQASFDALVAASDNMAIAAMRVLQERGIRIPEDVAVAGLNNEPEGRVITPPLTTGPLHFYEQGQKATEILLDLIDGNPVQEKVVLATQLLIRQSCGCPDPLVLEASTEPKATASVDPFLSKEEGIYLAIAKSLDWDPTPRNLSIVESLFRAFLVDVKENGNIFLSVLLDSLKLSAAAEEPISKWHTAISTLRSHVLSFIEEISLPRAENLFQQARVTIGETSQRFQAFQRLQAEQRARILSDLNQLLSATIDIGELLDILASALPQLNIARCYLSLYEDPSSPIGWSRLVMAYDELGKNTFDAVGRRFRSPDLAPAGVLPIDRRFSLVVEPLYFRNDQLGFVLFEADSHQEEVYEILRGQISGALKRTRLAEYNIELYNDALQARQVAEEGRQLAEQADLLKSRFLATVSHELRTPLTLITGMIEMMLIEDDRGETPLPASYNRDLKSIGTSAHHLARLISDVLDLASSQAGELQLTLEPLNLGTVIQEIMLLSEAIVREKGLAWRVELTPALPTVWADRTRLKQIILNLVSNATKFTDLGEVALSITADDKMATITVSDTGIGIPKDEQVRIFDEFQQSERTAQRGYGGMGLGLAITRRLVELQHGHIGVHSSGEEWAGSSFFFTIPVIEDGESQQQKRENPSQTVLLLTEQLGDDRRLRHYLIQRGYKVQELAIDDNSDWITKILLEPPGALVLAARPTEEKGWELIKLLKQNSATRFMPVVFYSLSEEKEWGSILELNYLSKPIRTSDLLQAMERQGIAASSKVASATILVVDDDLQILNLQERIIKTHIKNCSVVKARNGREALAIMEERRPDLVLLDLMMPEMDGFAVLEAMRDREQMRNVPVIVLTAQILTTGDMARLQRGVAAVLSKGLYNPEEVYSQVESVLSRSKHLGNETQRITRQAMAYIHEHYAELLTREQIAYQVGLSERHLNRCFNEETGMSIMTYLNRYRVRQAKMLLEKGDQSIEDVAVEVGFSSSSYFGRVFRHEIGISPGAYQRGVRPINC